MTRDEFNKAMSILISSVGRAMPDEQVQAWWIMLNDLTADQLNRGIVETVITHKFAGFPPLGVVRENSIGQTALLASERALLAWDRVVAAIRQHGAYQSVEFDDPLVMVTIRSICSSWPHLCDTPSEKLHVWTKNAFLESYWAHAVSGHVLAESAAALPGILAKDASLDGYESPDPVAIKTGLPATTVKIMEPKSTGARLVNAVRRIAQTIGRPIPPKPEKADEPETMLIEDVETKRSKMIAAFKTASK